MIFWRVLEALHGHAGVLAAIALLHPAILLRQGRALSRGRKWAVGLAAGLVSLAFGLGLFIYDEYRRSVKREIFERAPEVGYLFETKEHLAYAVLCLTIGGAICAFSAPRGERGLRRVAALLFAVAAVLCLVTSAMGTYVAAFEGFPSR